MGILSDIFWIITGGAYATGKILSEDLAVTNSQIQQTKESEQNDLIRQSEEQLSQKLGFPISKIPLRHNDEDFSTSRRYPSFKTYGAEDRRKMYAVAMILRSKGKQFAPYDPLKTKGGREFVDYVTGVKDLPEVADQKLAKRKKELEIMFDTNRADFERLLGRSLPTPQYPFSNKRFYELGIEIAIMKILSKEGYVAQDIWRKRERAWSRTYKLYTMKHSDFENVCRMVGFISDGEEIKSDVLKYRGEAINAIARRERWEFDSFNIPIEKFNQKVFDDAYEVLKD